MGPDESVLRDQATARMMFSALQQLKDSPDPLLRKAAGDLLSGRMTLRELAAPSDTREALHRAADGFRTWRDKLSDDQLAEIALRVEGTTDRLRAHLASEDHGDNQSMSRPG